MQYSKKAMALLNETIETIGKKEDHLQRKIDAEFANAKEFHAAGKTREALQCIRKKKVYDQQLTQLGTSKINLENQKWTMESMIFNAEIIDTLKVVTTSQAWVKKMEDTASTIETVGTLRETFRTLLRQMEMDGKAMNRSIDAGARASVLAMAPSELEVSVLAMAPRRRFFLDLLSPLRSLLPPNLAPR